MGSVGVGRDRYPQYRVFGGQRGRRRYEQFMRDFPVNTHPRKDVERRDLIGDPVPPFLRAQRAVQLRCHNAVHAILEPRWTPVRLAARAGRLRIVHKASLIAVIEYTLGAHPQFRTVVAVTVQPPQRKYPVKLAVDPNVESGAADSCRNPSAGEVCEVDATTGRSPISSCIPHKQPPVESPRCRESFVSLLHELSKDDRHRCQFCPEDEFQTHAVGPAPAAAS